MRRFRSSTIGSLSSRLAFMSFLLNLGTEASGIFLPLYAGSVGSSNLEVGFIAASYGIAFFAASILFGRQSDLHGRLVFIRWGLGISAIAYLSQIIARTPVALMISRGSVGFGLGMASAVIMAYTYENDKQIGNFVSYGSLGWLFGAFIAAVVGNYEGLFVTSALGSCVAFVMSFTLKEKAVNRVSVTRFPLAILKENRTLYFALFVRQFGANAIWSIMPLYEAALGASKLWIAALDGVNTGAQFIGMRLVERFNPARTFRIGLLTSALVFASYGVANHYLQLVPVQILLAVAWSCLFVGALSYLLGRNLERGTVAGQVYSTIYLSAGLGPFAGGAVSHFWGFPALMYFSSTLSLLGFLSSRGLDAGSRPSGRKG